MDSFVLKNYGWAYVHSEGQSINDRIALSLGGQKCWKYYSTLDE